MRYVTHIFTYYEKIEKDFQYLVLMRYEDLLYNS